MKKKLSSIILLVFITSVVTYNAQRHANTALSNLVSPTSVNQSLLPSTDNIINLGSVANSWRSVYLDSQIYIKNILAIHSRGSGNFFAGLNAGRL